MLCVITGLPGAGKTLFSIWHILKHAQDLRKHLAKQKGIPVESHPEIPIYYSGINGLKLPWIEHDPEKWMELPPGSIFVQDEAQNSYRPRGAGTKVPAHVSALETHRHGGVDLFLITQHPSFLDAHVRKLTGKHFHVVRKWGTQAATIHEWTSIKDNCDKQRKDSIKTDWRYPKEVFNYYHSAEVHTHKARIPPYYFIIAMVPVAVILAVWRVYSNNFGGKEVQPVQAQAQAVQDASLLRSVSTGGDRRQAGPMTAAQYLEAHTPRVDGLAYTAPIYDGVTQPTEAPYPAACVSSKTRCKCYSQQGTALVMAEDLCRQIADQGFFMAWGGRAGGNGAERSQHAGSQAEGRILSDPVLQPAPIRQAPMQLVAGM